MPVTATSANFSKELVAILIRRIIGVTTNSLWTEVVKSLRDQYEGGRKPYQLQAVVLISMARKKVKTPLKVYNADSRNRENGTR